MSQEDHKARAPAGCRCAVVTVSDTRTPATDTSGDRVAAHLEFAGHGVHARLLVPDEPDRVAAVLHRCLADPGVDAIILNGGTGLSRRDGTHEVVSAHLDKRIDGFGEIFRHLSYQQIGPAAMLSRAVAGSARGKVLISLPGSPGAVDLAMAKLVIPELPHMVEELRR
ncbi:MAG: MogA/MoaB family molybdenum cofactor biosynthesis protein [Planctomycetes bacterium]|nr:MogA/MoaB family molybdenum cofactor biosynthesis protein [Planctomycetota bacterium]